MATSNRLLVTELAETQNLRYVTVNEAIAKLEAGACLFGVVSVGDTAPPSSPGASEGDIYVIGASATGSWAGQDDKIAIYYNGSWLFLPALVGMIAYAADEDAYYYYQNASPVAWAALNIGATSTHPYDVPLSYAGTPTAGGLMGKVMSVRSIDFAADFAGSSGHVGTNPDATFAIDVKAAGITVGTISISTGGVFTFSTVSSAAVQVAAGNRIEFFAPSTSPAEATIADIAATLKGTVVF